MKKVLLTILIACQLTVVFAQTEAEKFSKENLSDTRLSPTELKSKLIRYDYSKLFTVTNNAFVYGFIGDNFQRIRLKIISITKDPGSPYTYQVYGKSMVKNNIDDFKGIITITNIRKYKQTSYGVDDELKGKGIKGQYLLIGTYNLGEAATQEHAGVFKGTFRSGFYLDKNNAVHYDDIDKNADGYSNNQFVGQWISHNKKLIKKCNWGDYRIPNAEALDIGAGEFSPTDKYLSAGWQTVRDAYNNTASSAKAKQVENAKWWE
ncbi:hypothetical protein GWR56_19765 [Mucilaginibacter sp. 14171R-50]|uniref:hypothetical protein n=1 Tax=Mucilaginibacter sp. 14171R-50 TaxID=2703789 RepID=UPI00138D0B31|nr:hypothetical protein [Mucilaginibacter sp. 14171R-50]QHS57671.1 hypothetical protein GWR56_19765 [Mucilaginibacter sp. 14171R-50]